MIPKSKFKDEKPKDQKESPIGTKEAVGTHPDSVEQEWEREEALKTVQQLTNGKGDTSPARNNGNYGFTGTDLGGLEAPNEQFDPRGRDLFWDYSDATMNYDGSYLVATSGPDWNTVVTRRGKSKRNRCRYKANSTQTQLRNSNDTQKG